MLRKHVELEIDPQNPFALDCLARKHTAEVLTRIIESATQPFVISIEAPWGWGKTTFIRMWKAFLESQGHLCFHFNAWETDFVDDPLIAFVGEMQSVIDEAKTKIKDYKTIEKHWEKVQSLGAGVLRQSLPLALQVATRGVISKENIEDLIESIASGKTGFAAERLKGYKEEKKAIIKFRKNLEDVAKLIIEHANYKSPLIFFIDELDRCRPDYAIALLERIKHLFSVNGFVFVLSIDRGQLINSVRALYGLGMETEGYLRRFIDLAYSLPQPKTEHFCTFLSERFNWREVFEKRAKGKDHFRQLIETFIDLANIFKFSLRVQEQCFTELNLVIRATPLDNRIYPPLLSFLVALKAHEPNIYKKLILNQVDIEEVSAILKETEEGKKFLIDWPGYVIEAYLIDSLSEEKKQLQIDTFQKILSMGKDQPGGDRAYHILKVLDGMRIERESGALKYLISRLEFVEKFM